MKGLLLILLFLLGSVESTKKTGGKKKETSHARSVSSISVISDISGIGNDVFSVDMHMPDAHPVLFRQDAAKNVFDVGYNDKWKKGLKNAMWKKFYAPLFEGCKAADLKKWFDDSHDPSAGAAAIVKDWAKHAKDGFGKKIPVHATAHNSYYNQLSDEFAAEEEYYDKLADFEYDEAVEDARAQRQLKRLQREKINILRLKKQMDKHKKTYHYKQQQQPQQQQPQQQYYHYRN